MQHNITLGIVKSSADPAQHGRLKVFAPAWDNPDFKVEDLPWCLYASPIGGTTLDIKAGREEQMLSGISTYGMWAVPEAGAQVLVACLDGNPSIRIWLGCLYMPEMNRTLPAGINGVMSELDDSGQFGQHTFDLMQKNLTDAGLWQSDKHWRTRGGYARSVSHPSNKNNNKPRDNGYASNPNSTSEATSQIWCWTTPGRHYIEMSDVKEESRIRVKTQQGNQIILDDTNERIYISTAKGRNYVELDETNGKVYVYSDSKVSIRSRNDINMYSDENINIVANKRVNIKSETRAVVLQARMDIRMLSQQADVLLTASRDIQLKTFGGPRAAPTTEVRQPDIPSRHSNPGGKTLIYTWPEKGGSASSSIRFDADESIEGLAQSPLTLMSATKVSVRSGGALNLTGSFIGHTAEGVGWSVGDTGLEDTDDELDGPDMVIPRVGADPADTANAVSMVNAETITDHMVRPEHESWTRDEDEGQCQTPRGPNYQG